MSICLKAQISVGAVFSNWIALRIDVLPWLTHNGHRFAELGCTKEPTKYKKPSPKLELVHIDISVSMSELRAAVWHGPLDTKGVCLIITRATVTRVDGRGKSSSFCPNKTELKLGRVQAVLLDVPFYESTTGVQISDGPHAIDLSVLERYDQISAFLGASRASDPTPLPSVSLPSAPAETTAEETTIFAALKLRLEQTCDIDYLVEVSSLVLMDQSLVQSLRRSTVNQVMGEGRISKHNSCSDGQFPPDITRAYDVGKDDEIVLEREERHTTWTVLVSGMKLLWTIDIRDAVVLLIRDFNMTIELMKLQLKVSNRGHKKTFDVNRGVHQKYPTAILLQQKDDSNSTDNLFQYDEQKSSLLRLLENLSSDDEDVTEGNANLFEGPPKVACEKSCFDVFGEREDVSTAYDVNPSFPVLVIHLFNPQIQLHSEQTGGGIILAMHGCYVEGREFHKLFADYSFDGHDSNLNEGNPKVLRKKEFLFQLAEVEAFSVDTEVDVDAGLQWLELGDAVDGPEKHAAKSAQSSASLEPYSPRYFMCEATMRKIMKQFSLRTRQMLFRQPLDLSPDEIRHVFSKDLIVKVGGSFGSKYSVMDRVEAQLDQLSFELDSYQFNTTLDLIRHVILAPPPMPRKLPTEIADASSKKTSAANFEEAGNNGFEELYFAVHRPLPDNKAFDVCDDSDSSISNQSDKPEENDYDSSAQEKGTDYFGGRESLLNQEQLQQILLELRGSHHKKRDRDTLRMAVQNLLGLLEEQQSESRSIRYVEWSLSKASWKIYSPDFLDDVEIELTALRGQHQFSSDSSMTTQLELEDLRINSLRPSPDAMHFIEPGAVLTTLLGAERTPCQRCGATFDRAANHTQSCRFHGDDFGSSSQYMKAKGVWCCCGATWEDAPGCKTAPHTGRERVALVRVESLPKIVKGLSLYKHVEVNIYPEVPHTLIVQMTKSVSKLFVSYFIGDAGGGGVKGSTKQDIFDVQPSKYIIDGEKNENTESVPAVEVAETNESIRKKQTLFGKQQITFRKGNVPMQTAEDTKTSIDSDSHDQEALPPSKKDEEVVFIKHLRIGNINTEISLVGFPIETHNYGIGVPAFTRAYKIGTSSYLSRKYVSHLVHEIVKSVAHSGISKVRIYCADLHPNP